MPILTGYDDLTTGRYNLPDGKHAVTVKAARLQTIKKKNGDTARKLAVEVTHAGNTLNIDLFVPQNDGEWREWSDGRRKFFKSQLTTLGLDPADIDTDIGRGKVIGQTIEVKSKPNTATGYQDYTFERLLSNTGDSLPSATERMAQQFDATEASPAGVDTTTTQIPEPVDVF